tara:strand:+ start:381 stop:914 length:534 start_codon:yes stop_codon:yes gene_type:complete
MNIENFISKSIGEWKSMRSVHSLAFNHFDEYTGIIKITRLNVNDKQIASMQNINDNIKDKVVSPFHMEWNSINLSDEYQDSDHNVGHTILLPIPKNNSTGMIIRSQGYSEAMEVSSHYEFNDEESIILRTSYENIFTEERIWFISDNVRCRTSVIKTKDSKGILKTSFSTEIKKIHV